ncbi:MAG: nucleotidyltransferase domain-containing protein [Gammaproteobacteria bacterium]
MKQPEHTLFIKLADAIRRHIPDVQAIYLFGSHVGVAHRPDSDVDLAVLSPVPLEVEKLFLLSGTLADIAKHHVDLVDLRAASTVMRSQIIANGRRIFCADEIACENFEDMVYSSYARLNEERRHILTDIQARGRIHG